MTKDNLVFGLAGTVVGIIVGVLIVNFSVAPRQQGTAMNVDSQQMQPMQQAPVQQAAPMQQNTTSGTQGQLPEGHPPVDESALKTQIDQQQKTLEKDPNNQDAIVNLGNLNFDLKNYPEAQKWYTKALDKDPKNVNIITDLGSCYLWQNDYGKALEFYNRSLSIDPNHFQTLMNVGIARMGTGDRDGAAEAWEKLVKLYPDNPDAQMLKDAVAKLKAKKQS